MIKRFLNIIELLTKNQAYLKNIVILLILSRLMFLEDSQLALISEIVASLAVIAIGHKGEDNG